MSVPSEAKRKRRKLRQQRSEAKEREHNATCDHSLLHHGPPWYEFGKETGRHALGLLRVPVGGRTIPSFKIVPNRLGEAVWKLHLSIPPNSGVKIATVTSVPASARTVNEQGELLLMAGLHTLSFTNEGRKARRVGIVVESCK